MPLGAFSAMFFGPYWCIRPTNIGTFPPACVKMKRMSLNLENVPVKSRFVTARAVSCGTSISIGETSGSNVRQHDDVAGCTNTTDLRRLGSPKNRWETGGPDHFSSLIVAHPIPS